MILDTVSDNISFNLNTEKQKLNKVRETLLKFFKF